MKNFGPILDILHKLLRKDPELNESEIALLKKKNIELTTLREAEYNSDEFRNELSRIRDILLNESLQIKKTPIMRNFYAHGFGYKISDHSLSLPESTEQHYVKINDWSNKRLILVDKENNAAYVQASSAHEDSYHEACSICVSRMELLAGLHYNNVFVGLSDYRSLYMKLHIPDEFEADSDSLSKLLKLRVTN